MAEKIIRPEGTSELEAVWECLDDLYVIVGRLTQENYQLRQELRRLKEQVKEGERHSPPDA